MGLAVSSQTPDDCVEELVEASAGDAAALEAAAERVLGLRIGDGTTRRTAVGLLRRAVATLGDTRPLLAELTDAGA